MKILLSMEDSNNLVLEKDGKSSTIFQDGMDKELKSDGEESTTADGTVKWQSSMDTITMSSLNSGTLTATTKSLKDVILNPHHFHFLTLSHFLYPHLLHFQKNSNLLSNMHAELE